MKNAFTLIVSLFILTSCNQSEGTLPDLNISSLTNISTEAEPRFAVEIRNDGSDAGEFKVKIVLTKDGATVGEVSKPIEKIDAGSSETVETGLTGFEGDYDKAEAFADSENAIIESNEDNNSITL